MESDKRPKRFDHGEFGADRSKFMTAVDSNNLEQGFIGKPVSNSHPALVLVIALMISAMGLFFILCAVGLIAPERARIAQEPLWFRLAFGSAFLLGGLAVMIQMAAGGANPTTGALPAAAPAWLRSVYRAIQIGIPVMLAAMFSWVAFGPGEREFTGSGPFMGETAGRIAFGIAAFLTWLALAVIGFIAARRRLRRCRDDDGVQP